ncbi:uncharacterized protein MYCFIDRAFT_34215 [Pseudocercospora fijiensis CIRAD86]|uniref:Peptidase M20 dimerisation domain-containing protein n=1 Tax=Pseudocercospora fijiensis (strain CIRAD86) TaxID=383855 RepID=M3APW4_PSEFD|nr:uncharacterized protein MYCFIDRAFT_34215 [Pseudocercospora fijiensis CIRAD86]EME79153.1 hypothetical protein MYCFIDRAFT_34215 [Pseudocercospora fijiensis CIRAD86]
MIILTCLTFILCITWFSQLLPDLTSHPQQHGKKQKACQQVPALFPSSQTEKLKQAYDFLFTETFQNASISRLSGAVQIKTESFDDLGKIGEDARWDVFYPFHNYLAKTFPLIHTQLKVEKVNTHGLLYTWTGSDDGKRKPIVLMAHQDTVPVDMDTLDSWTHPPWSGYYDGEKIWGRGASDCKNSLIGILETLEGLLEAEFRPSRTVVLAFGFDEECSGRQGAGHLSEFLFERYGEDGVAAIVDEGMGWQMAFGRGYATPGVAEKGYTDVSITVRTPGGHSSIPSDHTSIGILAEIITSIESQQYPTFLAKDNPFYGFLQCGAEYSPDFPKKLKKLLGERSEGKETCAAKHKDKIAQEAAKISKESQYLMQTSQAVDLIKGGTKTNALPEAAVAVVNHRINLGQEPEDVWTHITHLVQPIAKKYNLTLNAFNGQSAGYKAISLSTSDTTLRVAPITPTAIDTVNPFSVLSGTIRALYGEDTIVAPALMTGNTDTRYYWNLTKNIFRFGPGYVKEEETGVGKIHTVDESVTVSNHFKVVRWYHLFIRNFDEAVLVDD